MSDQPWGDDEGPGVLEGETTFADYEQLVAETRHQLSELAAGRVPEDLDLDDPADAEVLELRGTGEAAEGRVRATVKLGGVLESIELDPRVLRGSPEEVGAQLAEAVNAALEDLGQRAGTQAGPEAVDPDGLMRDLEALEDVAVDRMREYNEGIDDALSKIARSVED